MVEDFRFWTVARKYAFARTAINVREEIPEAADGRADTSEEAKEALRAFDAACQGKPAPEKEKKKRFMDKLKETFED